MFRNDFLRAALLIVFDRNIEPGRGYDRPYHPVFFCQQLNYFRISKNQETQLSLRNRNYFSETVFGEGAIQAENLPICFGGLLYKDLASGSDV